MAILLGEGVGTPKLNHQVAIGILDALGIPGTVTSFTMSFGIHDAPNITINRLLTVDELQKIKNLLDKGKVEVEKEKEERKVPSPDYHDAL